MELVFRRGSIEKFFLAFMRYGATELPQFKIIDFAGSGAFYQNLEYLKRLGLVEETVCYSEEKGGNVKCVRLTGKGERVLEKLREIREIVFGRPL
jgi:DNA-binding PadR family transcriptional regulator